MAPTKINVHNVNLYVRLLVEQKGDEFEKLMKELNRKETYKEKKLKDWEKLVEKQFRRSIALLVAYSNMHYRVGPSHLGQKHRGQDIQKYDDFY